MVVRSSLGLEFQTPYLDALAQSYLDTGIDFNTPSIAGLQSPADFITGQYNGGGDDIRYIESGGRYFAAIPNQGVVELEKSQYEAQSNLQKLQSGVLRSDVAPSLSAFERLTAGSGSTYINAEIFYDSPLSLQDFGIAPSSVVSTLLSRTDILSTTSSSFNSNFARAAANEINITAADFLDNIGYERIVNVNKVISQVGFISTHQSIFQKALGGQMSGQVAAKALLPTGYVFDTAIAGITTGEVDISQTTSALLPYNNGIQVDTEEVLYSLGLNLAYEVDPTSSGSFNFRSSPTQMGLVSAVESVVGIGLNVSNNVGDANASANIDFGKIGSLSSNQPTLDGLLNGLRDANGNLPMTATRAEILKVGTPGQVGASLLFSGLLDQGNSVNEGRIVDLIGDAKIDVSQLGTTLLKNRYESINVLDAAKELGIQDGELYKYSDFNKVLTDQPITQLTFLRALESELNVDFDLDNNLNSDSAFNPIKLSNFASFSENRPTLESLQEGLRDADGNLPEIATRAEIFNGVANGTVSLSRLLNGVLDRNNGVGEGAIIDRVGDVQVDFGSVGLGLIQNPTQEVAIIAAGEIGILGRILGAGYLDNVDEATDVRINYVVNRTTIDSEPIFSSIDNAVVQSYRGVNSSVRVTGNSATVYDADAGYSRIEMYGINGTVHVNNGGYNPDSYISIPKNTADAIVGPILGAANISVGDRTNLTDVYIPNGSIGTNVIVQAEDPVTQGGALLRGRGASSNNLQQPARSRFIHL